MPASRQRSRFLSAPQIAASDGSDSSRIFNGEPLNRHPRQDLLRTWSRIETPRTPPAVDPFTHHGVEHASWMPTASSTAPAAPANGRVGSLCATGMSGILTPRPLSISPFAPPRTLLYYVSATRLPISPRSSPIAPLRSGILVVSNICGCTELTPRHLLHGDLGLHPSPRSLRSAYRKPNASLPISNGFANQGSSPTVFPNGFRAHLTRRPWPWSERSLSTSATDKFSAPLFVRTCRSY